MNYNINNPKNLNIENRPNGILELRVEFDRIEEYLDFYHNNKDIHFRIALHPSQNKECLDFLSDFKNLKDVSFSKYFSQDIDLSNFLKINSIEKLRLHKLNKPIDLSNLIKLKYLDIEWSKNIEGLRNCKELVQLVLWHFNPKSKGFSDIYDIPNLQHLTLYHSNIQNLNGITKFNKLKILELDYMKNLIDVSSLIHLKSHLKELILDHCKKVKDFSILTELKNLTLLGFCHCGDIPDIKFIKYLKNLEILAFESTNIIDGDLSSCLELTKLKHIGFSNKRHYSHKSDELKSFIKNRK